MKTVRVPVGDDVIEYEVDAETGYGEDAVLLDRDDDLLAGTAFADDGFTVVPFLAPALYSALVAGVRGLIEAALARHVRPLARGELTLVGYHRVVGDDEHLHLVQAMGLHWPNEDLPIPIAAVERRVSEVLGVEVRAINPKLDMQHFQIRIVRPGRPDNNPPHRDVWLDRLRNAANVYVPLAGSDRRSSLPIVPGSHRWPEADIERTATGARIAGMSYTVPAVTGARRPLRMLRPAVRENQVLVFTPYAIHGGGANLNADRTRVSLELRFWRAR
jgi:hypothetical protein